MIDFLRQFPVEEGHRLSAGDYHIRTEAIAAGADGIIVEVHNDPPHAKCDGKQSRTPGQFEDLMNKATALAQVMGKTV